MTRKESTVSRATPPASGKWLPKREEALLPFSIVGAGVSGGACGNFFVFAVGASGWSGFETVVPMPDERAIEDVEIRRDRISRLIEEVTKPYETNEPHVAKTQSSAVG